MTPGPSRLPSDDPAEQQKWVQKTPDDLKRALVEQLGFLRGSGAAFDAGMEAEAKRIAVAVRVLVHNTNRSQALLHLLGVLDEWTFLDSVGPVDDRNLVADPRLVMMRMTSLGDGRAEGHYVPHLGDMPAGPGWAVDFKRWWNMPITKDSTRSDFSRADFVLALANQEGGAHVDPRSQSRIDRLARAETIGWAIGNADGTDHGFENDPLLPSVRQIGYEIEQTIHAHTGL